jgi:aryl-alcohol dehydrogenase-like predicted oxidoreductase
MSVLTGSRSDIGIEKLDKPSLLPFFEHKVKKQSKKEVFPIDAMREKAKEAAAHVAAVEAAFVMESPVAVVEPKPDRTETLQEKLARLKLQRSNQA